MKSWMSWKSCRRWQHNPLSQQKEFRAIKNAIIQEAERLRQQMEQAQATSEQETSQAEEPSSEETSTGASANPTLASESASAATSYSVRLPSEYLLNSTIRLFHQMGQIFRENAAPPSNPMGIRVDSKRRKKLMQKRLAMGHKQDDHEHNYGQTLQYGDCRSAASIAQAQGVTLCMECHNHTLTDTKESALALMEAISSPAFRMYWQPNQLRSEQENLQYLKLLRPYIVLVHVFQWKDVCRFPLADGIEVWKAYLRTLKKETTLLLEFMPDDQPQSLPIEAAALRKIIEEV